MVRVELRGIDKKEKFVEKVKAAATSIPFPQSCINLAFRTGPFY